MEPLQLCFDTLISPFTILEENTKLSIQNKLYNKAVFINDNIKLGKSVQDLLDHEERESFDIVARKKKEIIYKKGYEF